MAFRFRGVPYRVWHVDAGTHATLVLEGALLRTQELERHAGSSRGRVASFPVDHNVTPVARFQKAINLAGKVRVLVENGKLGAVRCEPVVGEEGSLPLKKLLEFGNVG